MAEAKDKFFDLLRIASCTFELSENLVQSRTAGGEILTAEMGPRLWRGSVSLSAMSHDDARVQAALVNGMMNAGSDFVVYDNTRKEPLKAPAIGNVLHPTFSMTGTVGRTFRFTSRQAGLVFSPGDLFSLKITLTSGTVQLLHEVSETVVTPASGQTFNMKMAMPIRGNATSASNFTFSQPFCHAKIVPGSVTPFSRFPDHASGLSFDWIQSVRS